MQAILVAPLKHVQCTHRKKSTHTHTNKLKVRDSSLQQKIGFVVRWFACFQFLPNSHYFSTSDTNFFSGHFFQLFATHWQIKFNGTKIGEETERGGKTTKVRLMRKFVFSIRFFSLSAACFPAHYMASFLYLVHLWRFGLQFQQRYCYEHSLTAAIACLLLLIGVCTYLILCLSDSAYFAMLHKLSTLDTISIRTAKIWLSFMFTFIFICLSDSYSIRKNDLPLGLRSVVVPLYFCIVASCTRTY